MLYHMRIRINAHRFRYILYPLGRMCKTRSGSLCRRIDVGAGTFLLFLKIISREIKCSGMSIPEHDHTSASCDNVQSVIEILERSSAAAACLRLEQYTENIIM